MLDVGRPLANTFGVERWTFKVEHDEKLLGADDFHRARRGKKPIRAIHAGIFAKRQLLGQRQGRVRYL